MKARAWATVRGRARATVRVRAGPRSERGSVLVLLPLLLAATVLVTVVVIEFGGHLVAISRAASLADTAALAAVSAETSERANPPWRAAAEVVAAGEGRLDHCDCPPGAGHARVRVSVEVPGLIRPRLGAARQSAESAAVLAPRSRPAPP